MPMTMTIYPYLLEDTCWVFDDERAGLKEEAFVLGMTEMISRLVEAKSVPNAAKGFAMTFAAEPFDHDVELTWVQPEDVAKLSGNAFTAQPGVGNWYRGTVSDQEMIGWLCPALFRYFEEAPKRIFVKADPLPAGLDPIWHVKADDPRAEQFVAWSSLFKPPDKP
jgi:hypothetical protein